MDCVRYGAITKTSRSRYCYLTCWWPFVVLVITFFFDRRSAFSLQQFCSGDWNRRRHLSSQFCLRPCAWPPGSNNLRLSVPIQILCFYIPAGVDITVFVSIAAALVVLSSSSCFFVPLPLVSNGVLALSAESHVRRMLAELHTTTTYCYCYCYSYKSLLPSRPDVCYNVSCVWPVVTRVNTLVNGNCMVTNGNDTKTASAVITATACTANEGQAASSRFRRCLVCHLLHCFIYI